MSDWYPAYECEPTMELRLFTDSAHKPPVLQQRWKIRNDKKVHFEWRDVPIVIDPAKPAG